MDVGVGMAANLLHTFNESHIEMFYLIVQEQNSCQGIKIAFHRVMMHHAISARKYGKRVYNFWKCFIGGGGGCKWP